LNEQPKAGMEEITEQAIMAGSVDVLWLKEIVASAAQVAVVWDAEGREVAASEDAGALLAYAGSGDGQQLRKALLDCIQELRPVIDRISVPTESEHAFLDITLLPAQTPDGLHILLLARDSTMEQNLSNALVASRRLYKDLVACSSDFAWETNEAGTFTYVSPRGALGFTAMELNGRHGRDLMLDTGIQIQPNPFESHVELTDCEILLSDAQKQAVTVRVSSLPIRDALGKWVGSRGVCRDITEQRVQEKALDRSRERERLSQQVIDAIHNELTPEDMVNTATKVLAEAMNVPHCWILRVDEQDMLTPLAHVGKETAIDKEVVAIVSQAAVENNGPWFEASGNELNMIIVRCGHKDANKGFAVAARSHELDSWSDDEKALITSVASHVGIAIAQAEAQERLVWLSRTDELTGLFNRRAFDDEVEMRLKRVERTRSVGALLYFDLDNFKTVNDNRGHADGDHVLMSFAAMLKDGSRATDIAARIGGDEFAMWLDDTDEEGAMIKALAVTKEFRKLEEYSGAPNKTLGVSIGIAVTKPPRILELKTLYAVSDAALYRVKREGKSAAFVGTVEMVKGRGGV
jgi:diguanylate cyclase (GGDEF)-like protein/PAS domain S-box-containing protein